MTGLNAELLKSASFDVEDLMAGPVTGDADGAETNEEGEATAKAEEGAEESEGDAMADTEGEEADSEATTTDGEESEEDGDEKPEAEDDKLEGLKPKAVKRFNKLLKQRDEARANELTLKLKLAELEAKQEQRQDEPVAVKAESDPLAAVTNEEQLEAHENYFNRVKAWCRRNPNGGIPPKELTGGVERELDVEAVVGNLEHAESMLEALPKRRVFLDKFRADRAEARKAYPKVFTPGTVEEAEAKVLLPKLLNFRTQADQDKMLARLVRAELMEREERDGVARYTRVELTKPKASTAKEAAVKPTPKPAMTSVRVPPVKAAVGNASKQSWDRVKTPGESVDVEELMGDVG